jgi:uncharacterized protein (DUF2141 family)
MPLKIFFAFILISFYTDISLQAQTLNVQINKVKSNKGKILLSIYNAEKGFPYESTNCIKIFTLNPQVGRVVLSTREIPTGTYAIALFHDVDDNGKLSTNMLGIPKEGYAFSNNASNFFGVPNFKDASFKLTSDTTIVINMKHF